MQSVDDGDRESNWISKKNWVGTRGSLEELYKRHIENSEKGINSISALWRRRTKNGHIRAGLSTPAREQSGSLRLRGRDEGSGIWQKNPVPEREESSAQKKKASPGII